MKAHAILAAILFGGLCTVGFAGAEDDAFDAKVKRYAEQVKKAWPPDKPESKAFYEIVAALKADFQKNNVWLFDNANWPFFLQQRAERELRMRRVRNAGKNPTYRSPVTGSKGDSALKAATGLDAGLDLHSTYDRKNGKARRIRSVNETKNEQ